MKTFFFKTIIYLIFLILFDGLFIYFVDVSSCRGSVLAAAIGVNVAYISLLLIPLLSPRKKEHVVLSGTLYLIGSFYFILELITAILFICFPLESILWPVIVQACLFAIYMILLLSSTLANDATQRSKNIQQMQGRTVRDRADAIYDIMNMAPDDSLKKRLSICYDELRNSPLVNSPEVMSIENEIDALIMLINEHATEGLTDEMNKAINQLRLAINKRNNKLKYLNVY